MSPIATLTLAWAAVHCWVAFQNAAFFARRRADLEYLAFAVMSVGFALYSVGAAIITDSTSYAVGTIGVRIAYIGAPAAFGAFVAFGHLLLGRPQSRVVTCAIAWSVVGLVLDAGGVFADPDDPAAASVTGVSPYVEPQLSTIAVVWVACACACVGYTLYQLVLASRTDPDARATSVAAALGGAAAVHDLVNHVLGLGTPYLLEHGAMLSSLTLSLTLTRRFVAVDEELEVRTRELESAYREVSRGRDARARREQVLAVGELGAVIAHEVRNPLAVLKNAVSGLRRSRRGRPEDRGTLLAIVEEETERLDLLAASLLDYTRPMEPGSERIAPQALLDAAAAFVGDREGIEIAVHVDPGAPSVPGDAELLCRAMVNLVDNAVHAMPAGGRLALTASAETNGGKERLVVSVADTGEGMDTLAREKALSPFFTTRPSGIGLGLALVERIVHAHRGTVRIESRFGGGTTVTVELPTGTEPNSDPSRDD